MSWIAGVASLFLTIIVWAVLRKILTLPAMLVANARCSMWPICAFIVNFIAATFAVHGSIWSVTRYIGSPSLYFVCGATFIIFLLMNAQMAGVAEEAEMMDDWKLDESKSDSANATLRKRHVIACNGGAMFGTIAGLVGAIVAHAVMASM